MALTLISVEDGYSIYEDENGDEVLLAGLGPMFRRVELWEDFDLESAWFAAVQDHRKVEKWGEPNRDAWVESLSLQIADPESIEVVWCESCLEPLKGGEAQSVDGGHACYSCYEESYRSCEDCGNTVHYENTTYTLSDSSVCSRCSDNNYLYCDECDGYYHSSDASEHRHGGCDCESPQQHFAMRNDGEAPLSQDERVTIALPSGVISQEGIESIARLVRNSGPDIDWTRPADQQQEVYAEREKWWILANSLEEALGAQWQTREGNYTKRLSKLAHKSQGLKIPPAVLSQVGCIARDNSTGVDFEIEVTRNLNLPAEDFYHEESCWWQSYSESRCSLKSNGGIGMRTFGGPYGEVRGRAWIMPLKLDGNGDLQPTFDSLTPDAFMVFNGYGDLSGYAPARIVAHMAGMTYRKIGFDCSPMYVNGSSGYLVASEEIAARYASAGRLHLYADTHSNLYHKETASTVAA